MSTIEAELKRLAELEKAATKGPWMRDHMGAFIFTQETDGSCGDMVFEVRGYGANLPGTANAAFIAELRNAAPGLIEVAQIAVEALGNCMDADRCGCPHKCGNCVGLSQISKALLKGRE